MPRYHALGTAIKLCVWNPDSKPAPNSKAEIDGIENISSTSTSAVFAKNHGLLPHKKRETSGPAIGCFVDDLKEEYFGEHEGVDFLASGIPFYLVKAGKELFIVEKPPQEDGRRPFHGLKEETLTTPSAAVLVTGAENTGPSSQVSVTDTTLSSIDTEFFNPNGASFTIPQQAEASEQLGKPTKLYFLEALANV
jgi:hypothetical protein